MEGVISDGEGRQGAIVQNPSQNLDIANSQNAAPNTGGALAASGGQDDEALSSLLLLLKSNQSKQEKAHIECLLNQQETFIRAKPSAPAGDASGDSSNTRLANCRLYSVDELRKYFHLPIVEVAKQLGICTTLLKKVCRNNKIKRWPYRQIRSITKTIQSLEMAYMNESLQEKERMRYKDQVVLLQNTLDLIIKDPNISVGDLNLPDNLLSGIDGFQGGGGASVNDDPYNLSARTAPNADVVAIIAAAAATADIEVATSESTYRKRKAAALLRENAAAAATAKNLNGQIYSSDGTPGASGNGILGGVGAGMDTEEDTAMLHQPINTGTTVVNYMLTTECGMRKIHFTAPVRLAELQRKKVKPTKKLVPLIEPDICNCMKLDFLPQTVMSNSSYRLPSDMSSEEMSARLASMASVFGSAAGGVNVVNRASQEDQQSPRSPMISTQSQSSPPTHAQQATGSTVLGVGGENHTHDRMDEQEDNVLNEKESNDLIHQLENDDDVDSHAHAHTGAIDDLSHLQHQQLNRHQHQEQQSLQEGMSNQEHIQSLDTASSEDDGDDDLRHSLTYLHNSIHNTAEEANAPLAQMGDEMPVEDAMEDEGNRMVEQEHVPITDRSNTARDNNNSSPNYFAHLSEQEAV